MNNDWETELEYTFPKTMTEEEKTVIRNNVRNLLSSARREVLERARKESFEEVLAFMDEKGWVYRSEFIDKFLIPQ